MQYFKAVRPDGMDFFTCTVDYGAALHSGDVVRHPSATQEKGDAGTYLSVATSAADCTGFSWPCRLFVVKPVGRALKAGDHHPNKRRVSALCVVSELPAHEVFGPQGEAVVALIERAGRLTFDEAQRLSAAGDAAWDAAGNAAGSAAWDAALALVVRDLISVEHFNTLYGPWASVIGDPS